jgi:hypothetical protein
MKILIATPAYGGEVTTTYCDTLIWLLDHFREKHPHIRFQHKFLSLSVLPFMRNLYASLVLQDKSFTHLLFVDADMGFAPSLIEHMIAADKPVVGSMAPHRKLDLAKFYSLKDKIADPTIARLVAMDYVNAGSIDFAGGPAKPGDNRSFEDLVVDGPCIRVRKTGAGVLLIQRGVFERLRERYPELWCTQIEDTYANFGLTEGVLQCFEPMPNEHGLYGGEDAAFCRRWVEGCGGEIWSVVTETIVHVGTEKYVGNFLTKLQHGRV